MIKVIEIGPFGCRIDRGTLEDLEDIPEGYEAKRIEDGTESLIVYVEPTTKEAYWRVKDDREGARVRVSGSVLH